MNNRIIDLDFVNPGRGFSKAQILGLTKTDIEKLSMIENPEIPNKENEGDKDKKDPNDGGPRPPKEDEFPEDDPFPEVSDPNGKDN